MSKRRTTRPIGRRHLLMGMGATALSACTSQIDTAARTPVTAANDPLSRFRFSPVMAPKCG